MAEKIVLFIGRFQPLHKGHVHAIKKMLEKYDRIIIAIGSTNKHDKENPFSYQLRKKMVRCVFRDDRRIRITGIKDYTSDKKWVKEICKNRFDAVVTGNAWVKKCLKEYAPGKPVFLKASIYNATKIRKKMRSGKKWKHLVPKEVYILIQKQSAPSH